MFIIKLLTDLLRKGLIINLNYKTMRRDETYLIAHHLPKDFGNVPAGGLGG